MPDPGVAPVPQMTDGQRDLAVLQAGGASPTTVQTYMNERTAVLRAGGVQQADIDRYWGQTYAPSPTVSKVVAGNLTRQAAANKGNLDFILDPVGSVSAIMGLDPKGVKSALDATADNFTGSIASAWQGFTSQIGQDWEHSLHPSRLDQIAPEATGAVRGGLTVLAAGGLVASPIVGAIHTIGAPVGKALADAGAPLPHIDVDLADSKASSLLDPSKYRFNFRMATKEEAEHGYGDIITGVAATLAPVPFLKGETPKPIMPEELRTAAVDAMRKGEIKEPIDVLQHGGLPPERISPAVRASIPASKDFMAAANRFLGLGATEESVLRVTHTLQDLWGSTGLKPEEIIKRAATDATVREELLTQDVLGQPVAPRTQASAPKPTPRTGAPSTAETEAKAAPVGKTASPTYVKSVEEAMGLMQQLEGSPDIHGLPQVSRAGAVGHFQILPRTATQYGLDATRLSDPAYNTYAARVIITDLYRRFDGNAEAMAIAYNDGPGRAQEVLRAPPGTRLEAVRDNSLKGGWRYVAVAADHDERFLPRETQEYAARARFKMGAPEGERVFQGGDEYTPAPNAEVPADVAVRNALDDEEKAAAQEQADEQRETIKSGGISAQSVWDNSPASLAYDEIRSATGLQRDVEPVKGLSLYDRAIYAISRLQPFKAVDDLAKKVVGIDPEKEFSALDAFRQAAHSDDRAKVAMGFAWGGKERGGIVVRTGDKEVKVIPGSATARGAFMQAIRDGGNTDDFEAWLIARRVVALDKKGTKHPFNSLAAQRIMGDPAEAERYAKAADQWDEFTKGVRDYAQKSGRYSPAAIQAMEDADLQTWVSFARLQGQEPAVTPRGFVVGSPVKRMKGSTEGVVGDVLANSLDNVRAMFRAADNNYAVGKLVSLAERNPRLAALLGIRKARIADVDPNLPEVDKEMKAFGIPEDQWDSAREGIAALMSDRGNLADNEFAYYRDGKKEVWQAGWPELIQAIKGSTPIQADAVTKIFQTIAHVVQGGVTALPDFAIKQFGSHQLVQFINHPDSPPPFLTGAKGIIDLMKMDGLMEKVMANGGLGSSIQQLDRDFHYDQMTQVLGETGWFDRARNDIGQFKQAPSLSSALKAGTTSVLSPFRMMRAIGERADMGNRLGLEQRGEAAGLSPLKAGSQAAEYGIDYTNRAGSAVVNWWASMVPFMRANLLYAEQAVKAIERNPAQWAAGATIAVTLPKMGLFVANMIADEFLPPDQQYRNLPAFGRLYYYITPPIFGQRFYMRMPDFAAFPFGAVPESIMMAMFEHDPDGFRTLGRTFFRDYVPPVAPPAVKAPLEVATNTNLETWQPLTPESMKGAAGQLRYITETSGPAKALAKLLGPDNVGTIGVGHMPPMAAVEHMVNGWADGLGDQVLSVLGAPKGPAGEPLQVSSLPFVHSFFMANKGAGQALSDYYDERARFDEWARGKSELKHEIQQGDTENVQQYGAEAVRMARAEARLNQASAAIGKMRDAIAGIDRNPKMADWEKQQRTEHILNAYLIPTARAYTTAMRQARENER